MKLFVPVSIAAALMAPVAMGSSTANAGEVIPVISRDYTPDPDAHYLFYLHGLGLETGEVSTAQYQYPQILEQLAARDLIVVGEHRKSRTDMWRYAKKVGRQVKHLRRRGVPPSQITIAGHSKGGFLSLVVSILWKDPRLRYIIIAGCPRDNPRMKYTLGHQKVYKRLVKKHHNDIKGDFLIVWDRADRINADCDLAMEAANANYRNLELQVGAGHSYFHKPKKKWLDIVASFAKNELQ